MKLAGPNWLDNAKKYIGTHEIVGPKHNSIILNWWIKIKNPWFRDDETPWCAGYVGAMLEEVGIQSTRSAAAQSYKTFGKALKEPAVGCIVVFWRGSRNSGSGHVGFVVGQDHHGNLMVLGGNQSNAVNIKPFSRERVLAYRWPGVWPYQERFKLPIISSDGKISTNES